MRMLIRSYPELAEQVFDKCIKQSENKVEMNFEFLEDTFSLNQRTTSSGKTLFYHDDLGEVSTSFKSLHVSDRLLFSGRRCVPMMEA